jgi:hypothetical protein
VIGDGRRDVSIKASEEGRMRLRERARFGAALAQCAPIRGRRKLGMDLSNKLPEKIHHATRVIGKCCCGVVRRQR